MSMELIRRIRRAFRSIVRRVLKRAFNWRILARASRREYVLCIGDSNILVLKGLKLPHVWLHRFVLGGVTVSGLPNPNLHVQYSHEIADRLARAKPWHQVLFMLGGVDCSFVIWHESESHGSSAEDLLKQAIAGYEELIRETIDMRFKRVMVVSAPLPTMGDPEDVPINRGARGSLAATQADRTKATIEFNAAIERYCSTVGAEFIDVASHQLDPAAGFVAARFVREGTHNHHLKVEPYRELIVQELSRLSWNS